MLISVPLRLCSRKPAAIVAAPAFGLDAVALRDIAMMTLAHWHLRISYTHRRDLTSYFQQRLPELIPRRSSKTWPCLSY
ncbi:hypothetical protein DL89DRAFT_173226 [Linderina pennispora]|uniref:Uncharacterized protein n=1 Tax=Linderina pennispora TaxID=61395 RepID=A0A1Y1W6N2_9FUNG|nr:uncharacterized protein DL89DRAFT_173226 [Linderina pennispora]ORX69207.1 hypothetical protein DL89DRAFT_173226 [Linderina pennispora]